MEALGEGEAGGGQEGLQGPQQVPKVFNAHGVAPAHQPLQAGLQQGELGRHALPRQLGCPWSVHTLFKI